MVVTASPIAAPSRSYAMPFTVRRRGGEPTSMRAWNGALFATAAYAPSRKKATFATRGAVTATNVARPVIEERGGATTRIVVAVAVEVSGATSITVSPRLRSAARAAAAASL